MRAVTDPEAFRTAPIGRYYVGPSWAVWCWDATLCGSIVWGRPSLEEARGLVRMFEIERLLAPRFDAITDASRMALVTPAAFAVVAEFVRERLPVLAPCLRKSALVTPAGIIGAALAGLYPMLLAGVSWRPVTTAAEALAWIDSDAARAAAAALAALAAQVTGGSALLHALHAYLRAHLTDASIDGAASALHLSRRSLQRGLTSAGTRFRDQLDAVRIDEARRRLAESDDKLEAIAAELGYSSASHFGSSYAAVTGETPGQYRARYREPQE